MVKSTHSAPRPDPPNQRLFRYLSVASEKEQERVRDIFLKHELYFPSPTLFNDPFDCKVPPLDALPKSHREEFIADFFKRKLLFVPRHERRKKRKELSTKAEFAKVTQWIQENVDACGVLCLSEPNDDILMWSHYADKHRGICLEFAATSNIVLFGEAQPVQYVETYTDFPLLCDGSEQVQRVLRTKSSHWNYEGEWRIIRRSQIVDGRPKYVGSRLCEFSANDLKGVIFGCQCSPETVSKVTSWAQEGSCQITRYRTRRKDRAYGLEIIPF